MAILLAIICVMCSCFFKNKNIIKESYLTILKDSDKYECLEDWSVYILSEIAHENVCAISVKNDTGNWIGLPLTVVLEQLGVKITWKSENVATLDYEGKKLFINEDKQIIHEKRSEFNELSAPTGGKVYYEFIGGEVIVCSSSLVAICFALGIQVNCVIMNEKQTIHIGKIENSSLSSEE